MRTGQQAGFWVVALGALVIATAFAGEGGSKAVQTADEIRQEAVRPNGDPEGLPLPLMASWNVGMFAKETCDGWRPENQMKLIADGHHILPFFGHPRGAVPTNTQDFVYRYYKSSIERARELKLPITFLASQWESGLSRKPYIDLPAAENPNVVTADGKAQGMVSPVGPVAPWREIGRQHTDEPWMKQLQQWYPKPPLVMFLSNNEHGRLELGNIEMDQRYLAQYGKGKDDAFKSQILEKGYTERMRALQQGMRDGLTSAAWKRNAIFCGYDVVDRPFSRDAPEAWDGASPSYYIHDWLPLTDYQATSAAICTMYWPTHLHEVYQRNPKLWWEISLWDGGAKKIKWYRDRGQVYDPARYEGLAQFAMWLHRPRVVREFRGWTEPWVDVLGEDGKVKQEGGGPYFMAVLAAVDRVYSNPTLKAFWRKGQLVQNGACPTHADTINIFKKRTDIGSFPWFMLDTSLDPAKPWNRSYQNMDASTVLPVLALGLVQGKAPERQWLVFAHAPLGLRKGVEITVPDYGKITVDVTTSGSFWLVDEKTKQVTDVKDR